MCSMHVTCMGCLNQRIHALSEAHPEKFNSRIRNKMFYGQMGGKDLVMRKWKDLSDYVTLECDGQDMTGKLKEHRVHAILFLNIPSYGGGTRPWGGGMGKEPSTEDGLIEVVGLTTYQLPMLQAGAHGTSIAQCSTAKLVTSKTIPMQVRYNLNLITVHPIHVEMHVQVDGEACRLLPSIISLSLLNKATMLAKRRKSSRAARDDGQLESLALKVMRIQMSDYETYQLDKDQLKASAKLWLPEPLHLDVTTDLESLRKAMAKDCRMDDCCFLDCKCAQAGV